MNLAPKKESAAGEALRARLLELGMPPLADERSAPRGGAVVELPSPLDPLRVAIGPTQLGDPALLTRTLRLMSGDLDEIDRARALLRDFSHKLIQSYEETYTLFRVMRLLASAAAPLQQIRMVCRNVHQTLPFGWICTAFRDDPRVIEELRGSVIAEGQYPCSESEFRSLVGEMVGDLIQDGWTRVLTPADHRLAAVTGAEMIREPITYDGAVIGLLIAGNKRGSDNEVSSPEIQFIDAVADFLGTFHENIARFAEQRAMSLGTLHALTAAIDAKDRYTRGHSERVAYLSKALALAMGLEPERAERVRIAGVIHDVGKIGVPEAILGKSGKLTVDEFAAIKRHPEIGYGILRGIVLLEDALPGVLHHHERWDGRGYPHGIAGEDIPLVARIIGLADAFDAMSSTRSYRPAMPRANVLAEIARCAGGQFDPEIVKAFGRVDITAYDTLLARQAAADAELIRLAA